MSLKSAELSVVTATRARAVAGRLGELLRSDGSVSIVTCAGFVLPSVELCSDALDYRCAGGGEASVAKRKSLVVRLYQEHRKASAARERERERAAKEFVRNQERIACELETERKVAARAEEKYRRDAARAAELALKAREQEDKGRQATAMKTEQERTRAAAAAERGRAARAREAAKAAVEAQHAEARARKPRNPG
jgi:hypothetical protein